MQRQTAQRPVYLKLVIETPPVCAKCGSTSDGRTHCARCGLATARTAEFLAAQGQAPGVAELAAAWTAARARWADAAAHDQLLALARQHEAYAWLAARYRELARGGDTIAEARLARVQRVVELAVMLRAKPDADSAPTFSSIKRMVIMLTLMVALGFAIMKQVAKAPTGSPQPPRSAQRGSAMLIVLIIIAALMAGMATLVSMQSSSANSVDISKKQKTALHCAEAGLVTARGAIKSNYTGWNAALAAGTEPTWLAGLDHDLDDDGASDFTIVLKDNNDETVNDLAKDQDLSIYVTSTCTKFAETPVTVSELVRYNGGNNCYQAQLGGCGGNNNAN